MKKIKFIFLVVFLLNATFLLAGVQKVTDIRLFPEDGRTFYFYVVSNDNGDAESAFLEFTEEGTLEEKHKDFSFEKIINEGEVIYQTQGYDVVIFHCPKCNVKTGGKLRVKYLRNAIYSSYKSLYVYIKKNSQNIWEIYTEKNEKINYLQLWPNYVLGELVGIDEITVNDQEHNEGGWLFGNIFSGTFF